MYIFLLIKFICCRMQRLYKYWNDWRINVMTFMQKSYLKNPSLSFNCALSMMCPTKPLSPHMKSDQVASLQYCSHWQGFIWNYALEAGRDHNYRKTGKSTIFLFSINFMDLFVDTHFCQRNITGWIESLRKAISCTNLYLVHCAQKRSLHLL